MVRAHCINFLPIRYQDGSSFGNPVICCTKGETPYERLARKYALITGASQGLGRALAIELAEAGLKVALVARQNGPLEEAVNEIRRSGGIAYGISADIGDKRVIYPVAGQAAALIGSIH